jgi:hypothetical protein
MDDLLLLLHVWPVLSHFLSRDFIFHLHSVNFFHLENGLQGFTVGIKLHELPGESYGTTCAIRAWRAVPILVCKLRGLKID